MQQLVILIFAAAEMWHGVLCFPQQNLFDLQDERVTLETGVDCNGMMLLSITRAVLRMLDARAKLRWGPLNY